MTTRRILAFSLSAISTGTLTYYLLTPNNTVSIILFDLVKEKLH
jgi:hypothetical protein